MIEITYRSVPVDSCRHLAGRIRRCLGVDQGATLVETALASMILFTLLLGIFEFSLGFYTYHYTSNAARQGSRYAIVRGSQCQTDLPAAPASFHCNASDTDIANYVKSLGYPGIDAAENMTVNVSTCAGYLHADTSGSPKWSSCTQGTGYNDPGDEVQVVVTYNFPLAVPFWKYQTLGITSTSSMVYSQ